MTQTPPPNEPTAVQPEPNDQPAHPEPAPPIQQGKPDRPEKDPLRASRTSGAWIGLIGSIVLIVLLVIFVVQNTESTSIEFLGWDGRAPLAVSLLVAAAVGMAIAALIGSLRIIQLRRRVRQEKKRNRRR